MLSFFTLETEKNEKKTTTTSRAWFILIRAPREEASDSEHRSIRYTSTFSKIFCARLRA